MGVEREVDSFVRSCILSMYMLLRNEDNVSSLNEFLQSLSECISRQTFNLFTNNAVRHVHDIH